MKYINGKRIIAEILNSYVEYEQIPSRGEEFFLRLLDDLHYTKKIKADTINWEKSYSPHMFEEASEVTK